MRLQKRMVYTVLAACAVAGTPVASSAADLAGKPAPGAPVPMVVGGWLFSPTLFAGGIYNTNVNQTSTNRVASWGERVVPGFTADLNNGLFQTSLYGIADIQNYANSDVTRKTTVDAKAGATETWFATRDLTLHANVDYTRQADVFGSSAFAPLNTPLSPTSTAPVAPVTVSPQASPDRYNQYSGAAGFDKRFGRVFFGGTASVVSTQFDSNPALTTSRDGTIYTVADRLGFDLTPQIYAFADGSYNWQRYRDSLRNSQGYRATGGVGTGGPGIWQGEIYAGYQSQKNDVVGTYDSGVYGVRLGYSPTPMWVFRASLDETLGASTIAVGGTTGLATRVTSALGSVAYNGLPRGWGVAGRGGYVHTDFVNDSRRDNAWLAGFNVTYELWRNLGLTLDYQYKTNRSNAEAQSFDQQVVSLGASYRY